MFLHLREKEFHLISTFLSLCRLSSFSSSSSGRGDDDDDDPLENGNPC